MKLSLLDSMTIAFNVKTQQAVSMCVLLVFTTTIQLHMFGERLMTDLFVHGVIQERAMLNKGWWNLFDDAGKTLFTSLHLWNITIERPNCSRWNLLQPAFTLTAQAVFRSDLDTVPYATAKVVMMQCCYHSRGWKAALNKAHHFLSHRYGMR